MRVDPHSTFWQRYPYPNGLRLPHPDVSAKSSLPLFPKARRFAVDVSTTQRETKTKSSSEINSEVVWKEKSFETERHIARSRGYETKLVLIRQSVEMGTAATSGSKHADRLTETPRSAYHFTGVEHDRLG